jgi:3-dehydroquinate synthase
MKEQSIIFTKDTGAALSQALSATAHDRLFVLTDETTRAKCLPLLSSCAEVKEAGVITIAPGDTHKNVESLVHVWKSLSQGKATRHSLLLNVGGGMVTDLGGFAAATFKRGIPFINIPTTLLAMVDASAGGKTGINLGGLKNEVGVFRNAAEVIIDTTFLSTLDSGNLCSGFAEMLKHGLISNREDWAELVNFDLLKPDLQLLQQLIEKSVNVKKRIVSEDPEEHGIRKALNLGHTAGHAIESLSMLENRPVLHGYAVAWGLVCELYLSCKRLGFPHDVMLQTVNFIKQNYGVFTFNCKEYDKLYELMTHDKKNTGGVINFTLLSDIGRIRINQPASKDEIFAMLDFYRETMGC